MSEMGSDETFPRLSRAIQERKVVLWAGAGLSCYAGYPIGGELANLLLKRLGKQQDANEPLPNITERFEATFGREELIHLLEKVFGRKPTSIETHKQIEAINRFPYIITTNYDPLFEKTYGNNLVVIIKESDLSKTAAAGEKQILYKIHGDPQQPETIVITKSDYERLDKDSLVWVALRTRLAEYSILFIGYALQDKNVIGHLQTVLQHLGNHANPYYLIDKKIDDKKRKDLEEFSLEFIEMNADQAIEKIYNNISEFSFIESKNSSDLRMNNRLFQYNNIKVESRENDGQLKYVKVTTRDRTQPMNMCVTL